MTKKPIHVFLNLVKTIFETFAYLSSPFLSDQNEPYKKAQTWQTIFFK